MTQLVVLINEATDLIDAATYQQIAQTLNEQMVRDFNQSGWVRSGQAPACDVAVDNQVPAGAWGLRLKDSLSGAPGALGYHEETGGVPDGLVGVQECIDNGVETSACASHELAEMLCDPYVDRPKVVRRPGTNRFYIVEVGDPVQEGDYEIGTGLKGADFAYRSWWGLSSFRPTSFRGTATQPFEVCPGGYISYEVDGVWKQIFRRTAAHPVAPSDPDDRPRLRGRPALRAQLAKQGKLRPVRIEPPHGAERGDQEHP